MAKKRVHEVVTELKDVVHELKDLTNQAAVTKLQAWGYEIKSHSSTLEDDQIKAIKDRFTNEARPAAAPKPASSGVVIRRSKALNQTLAQQDAAPPPPPPPPPEPVQVEEAEAKPAPEVAPEPAPAAPEPASEPTPASVPVTSEAPKPATPAPATAEAPAPQAPASTPPPAIIARIPERPRIEVPLAARPPIARPANASARAPGVRGTATNTYVAPTVSTRPPGSHPLGANETIKADEEVRMINGVAHVVQKDVGRPTANQARIVSRPVIVTQRVTPAAGPTNFPRAPGIRPNDTTQNFKEGPLDTGRREVEIKKGRRPSGTRNEKVENYSKQDLLDLVRARAYVPVIGRKKRATKKGKKTEITEMKASKKVITIESTITVRELSEKLGVKAPQLIGKLMKDAAGKIFTINQPLDYDTASLIASDHGWEVKQRTFEVSDFVPEVEDKPEDMKPRPPVVTVMGHVDHGKTSLLDAIRQANVAEGEAGGITQHIGAYSVTLPGKGDITFLDTPGHEAFSAMRERGAQATDIVILVVAADDGVQPQTIESIKHAKAAEVPIVVAINKIDKAGTNPDTIKGALAAQGLQPEDWGGDTPMIPVSARQKTNLELLLENVLLQAEVLELQSNPKKAASGVTIESKLDRGRGAVSTVLVQDGTLKNGDALVCGACWGRVRMMTDDKGRTVQKVTAGYPVQVVGLSGTPTAGEDFQVMPDEEIAKKVADHRVLKARETELAKSARLTIEDLAKKVASDAPKELLLIVKADVQGSAEAVTDALRKLSGKKVVVNVISRGVGGITENDVNQARASKAAIVGFNVKPDGNAAAVAQQDGTKVKSYSIIYELLDDVRVQMEDLLEPIYRERALGKAEVRQVFAVSKVGNIAGSIVTEGKITRTAQVRVIRERKVIYSGKLSSLKRFKDDVREVVAGTECGISIENYTDIQAGDTMDLFEIETIRQKLD